jgi:Flp pilus assembly protein TadD
MLGAVLAERDGRYGEALEGFRRAAQLMPADNRLSLRAAEMAYQFRRPALADTLLGHIDSTGIHCDTFYERAALDARARGLASVAGSLLRHRAALEAARPRPAGKR